MGHELEKLIRAGHLENGRDVDGYCFISLVAIKVENDGSVKIALDFRKLKDSCIEIRPHVLNMEDLINRLLVAITRFPAVKLFFSNILPDNAYGQLKLAVKTSQQANGNNWSKTLANSTDSKRVLRT